MKSSIKLERTKKENINKIHTNDSFEKRMKEIEKQTKEKMEKILDKKHKDTTDRVLENVDKSVTL